MTINQQTKVVLKECTINNVPFVEMIGDGATVAPIENFTLHSFRIYEDICKPYFTAQMVIEDQLNISDDWLYPAVEVFLSYQCPPNNKTYSEKFRVYSIDSKPKQNDLYGGMLITLNLIGEEYYLDSQNTVIQNFKNTTASNAAEAIHKQFLGVNGPLTIKDALGLIGKDPVSGGSPHQVLNKKPIKAIHDLLDKAVSSAYKSGAWVYFRNKPGYVIAPLEDLLNSAGTKKSYIHKPAQGAILDDVLVGYDKIIHLRPMVPSSQETAMGMRAAELSNLNKSTSYFDAKSGEHKTSKGKDFKGQSWLDFLGFGSAAKEMINTGIKTSFGSFVNFNVLDTNRQDLQVDKAGPGNFMAAEHAFLASLSLTKKYWISVPGQSGIDITVGDKIHITYPMGATLREKNLFVARCIHEVQFKTPGQQRYEPANAITEFYAVDWN